MFPEGSTSHSNVVIGMKQAYEKAYAIIRGRVKFLVPMIRDAWCPVINIVNEVKPDDQRLPVWPNELTISFIEKKGMKYTTAAEYQVKRHHKINLWSFLFRCVRTL